VAGLEDAQECDRANVAHLAHLLLADKPRLHGKAKQSNIMPALFALQ
jgi:hypothetical protein